jgi:hypothetical protein
MTRTGLALVLALLFLTSILAADDRDRESLRDLEGVRVAVEDLSLATPVNGFSADELKKAVESKLKEAGIPVLNQGEYPVGDPYLRVCVATTKKGGSFVAFHVQVDFVQIVFLRRNPSVTFNRAETWKAQGRMGIVRSVQLADELRRELSDQVAQFITAYRSVNSR